jgi:hypothetical protein
MLIRRLFHIASHIEFVTEVLCELNAKLTTTRTNAAPEHTEDIKKITSGCQYWVFLDI